MRQTIISTLLLLTFQAFGQIEDTAKYWTQLGQLSDGTVKAFFFCDKNKNCKYLLQYQNGKQLDTLTFEDVRTNIDSCEISAAQIDGKGLKEIIISWNEEYHGSTGKGGFEKHQTINEIWNLDSRKRLFYATSYYYSFNNTSDWSEDSAGEISESWTTIETIEFSYNFSFGTQGQLIIKDLKKEYSSETTTRKGEKEKTEKTTKWPAKFKGEMPDHTEGIYVLKDGEFVLSKGKTSGNIKIK